MPRRGVEPPSPCEHWHLKPACLPFHHLGGRQLRLSAECLGDGSPLADAGVWTGFLGGFQGRIVARALDREGIADAFVTVRGESRLCIAVVDPAHGTQTEINERGPEVSGRAVRALLRRVTDLLSQPSFEFVVLS